MKSSLTFLFAGSLLGAGLTLAPVQATAAEPAAAAVAPQRARPVCDVTRDGGDFRHGAFQASKNSIAQLTSSSFAPGYKRTVTRKVSKVDAYRAGATVKGSLRTKIGKGWLAEAEIEVSAELSAAGEWSTANETTVTDLVHNTSKQNATFVFFRGSAKKVTANVLVSTCKDDDGGSSQVGHLYWKKVGVWRTFTNPTDGAVRCGGGTKNLNSVAKRALQVGCA